MVVKNRGERLHRRPLFAPIQPFILDEICETLAAGGYLQCFSWRALGKDYFVGFQLDMEVFDGFAIVHLSRRDRSTVHQVFDWNKNPIDEKTMLGGKVQIASGIMIVKGKASDPDRRYAPVPGRGILLDPLTSDTFDWQRTIECFDQIADLKVFNRN